MCPPFSGVYPHVSARKKRCRLFAIKPLRAVVGLQPIQNIYVYNISCTVMAQNTSIYIVSFSTPFMEWITP